jgi:hypothetical protein
VDPSVQLREAPHVAQDTFGQVARTTDRRSDVTAPVIMIHMRVGGPQSAAADVTATALRPQHSAE